MTNEYTTKLLAGEVAEFTGTSGLSKLKLTWAGVKVTIECAEDTFTGELEANGATKGEVKFKNCKVLEKEGNQIQSCEIKEPIEFKFNDQLEGTQVEDKFEPAAPPILLELTIEGSPCTIAGTYKVEGTWKCTLPSAGTLRETHEIVCEPSGSSLKMAGNAATFTSTEKVKLVSGENWAME